MKIQDLRAREIIDCKGKPLLEVDIITEDGTMGRAASPSGISAGEHEAMVLRDGDQSRYDGNGVRKAVEMAEKVVLPAIQGMDVLDQQALDRRLMELDGTPNKSRLGGNVTYSTSLAVMRAGCQLRHVSQYRYLNPGDIRTIPLPTSDMFAGGSYEDDTMPVQETTIVPYKASSIAEATEILCKVYKKLPEVIREFQGGRRPEIGAMSEYMAPSTDFMDCLDILYETAKRCHCEEKIAFHMDCAFSEIYDAKRGTYHYCGREVDLDEERRLFYVGLTRARSSLFMSHCASRRMFGKTFKLGLSSLVRRLPQDMLRKSAIRRHVRKSERQLSLFPAP